MFSQAAAILLSGNNYEGRRETEGDEKEEITRTKQTDMNKEEANLIKLEKQERSRMLKYSKKKGRTETYEMKMIS